MPNLDSTLSTSSNVTDAFVEIRLDRRAIGRTPVIVDNLNPEWNETYCLDVCHRVNDIIFVVLDKDSLTVEKCGSVIFRAKKLLDGIEREDINGYSIWKRPHCSERGRLYLSIQFVSLSEIESAGYDQNGYFPIRQNCRVTLYQDAHVPDTLQQFQTLDPPYQPKCCWKDIYFSLMNAQQLICIAGWSVWHELIFFRGADNCVDSEILANQKNLGKILVDKANEGVKVYVMVWDEATTSKNSLKNLESVVTMNTHDEETHGFFKHTGLPAFYFF